MKMLVAIAAVAMLAGCGVDAVGSAATAAALKKQEIQDGRKTLEQAQQKIDTATQQMQQAQERAAASTDQ